VFRLALAVALMGAAALATAADTAGVATIVEGKASVIHGNARYDIVAGTRLAADDLLRTGDATFLRVEYADGSAVDLGPNSELQLNAPGRRKAAVPALYLLSGWLKLSAGSTPAAGFSSPRLAVSDIVGSVVVRVDAGTGFFVEQGSAHALERRGHGNAESMALKSGSFLALDADRPAHVQDRPAPDFVAALPRYFRDPLPLRYEKFAGHPAASRGRATFTYADVAVWLNAEPAIRRPFVQLWRERAGDPPFREGLEHDLALHPEWDPILHPPVVANDTSPAGATAAAPAPAPTPVTAPH